MKRIRYAATAVCIAGLLAAGPGAAAANVPAGADASSKAVAAASDGQVATPAGIRDEVNRLRCLLLGLC